MIGELALNELPGLGNGVLIQMLQAQVWKHMVLRISLTFTQVQNTNLRIRLQDIISVRAPIVDISCRLVHLTAGRYEHHNHFLPVNVHFFRLQQECR